MIVGAVLAAGAGRRMGRPKGELIVDGVRLVDRAVTVLRAGGCDRVVAVVRPGVAVPEAAAIENLDPDRGMRSSLELAIAAAAGCDVLAVLPADMPGVGSAAVRAVLDAWQAGRVAMARYADGDGHPVAMAPDLWLQAVAGAGPDEGARRFLAVHKELVDVVEAPGDRFDLDAPTDFS